METEKKLIFILALLLVSFSVILTAPLYAHPEYTTDCVSCHTQGGITLGSNVTGTLQVNASSSFGVEVTAEGQTSELTIKWASVADNPSFTFTPTAVTDNLANDLDTQANKVKSVFKIIAPTVPGNYTIQVFAAGSGKKGGTQTFLTRVASSGTPGGPIGNLPPTAYFLFSRQGMTVNFKDRSWDLDGNITSWRWSFGDNTNSTEKNPTHTFTEAGTYTVTLTVTDNKGDNNTQSRVFTVPSKNELLMFWATQIFIGSLMIVFTSVFAIGIVSARFKRGGRNG